MKRPALLLATLAVFITPATAEEVTPTHRDVEFAAAGDTPLLLDLYLPDKPTNAQGKHPLVVWVHGGAWRRGSKESAPLKVLTARGFAVASVGYRLTPVAPFPANVHDIKAAIRFLRAGAATYGLDPGRFAVAGASAGGHLAALVGTTNGHTVLEGTLGDHTGTSSDVQATVSLYGASNLQTILAQSTPHGLSVREPALELLLGDLPDKKPDAARLASPVAHVDDADPPLLLVHGDQDPQMPINQSHELHGAFKAAGRPVRFHVLHGAAHGGAPFYDSERLDLVTAFLTEHLKIRTRR